jgi:sugar transferase EpsL
MHANAVEVACKRVLDLTIALLVLAITSPLMLMISISIWLTMGKPILFRQSRPGYRARLFTLLKFRTMIATQSLTVDPATDAARLTSVGVILRRFSLDELPQLWNVLKGEMSLVGPRPLLIEYLDYYTPEQARRHLVKPGITGLAQVKGRNTITWNQKFLWDIWYVDHWSFWLDLQILWTTLEKVIRGEGISQQGHATMEKFGVERR